MRHIIKLLVKLSPWEFLIASIAEVGWDIVVEEEGEFVQGLIIGTEEYVEQKIRCKEVESYHEDK